MTPLEILQAILKGFALVGIVGGVIFVLLMFAYLCYTAWLSVGERGEDEGVEIEEEAR